MCFPLGLQTWKVEVYTGLKFAEASSIQSCRWGIWSLQDKDRLDWLLWDHTGCSCETIFPLLLFIVTYSEISLCTVHLYQHDSHFISITQGLLCCWWWLCSMITHCHIVSINFCTTCRLCTLWLLYCGTKAMENARMTIKHLTLYHIHSFTFSKNLLGLLNLNWCNVQLDEAGCKCVNLSAVYLGKSNNHSHSP